MRSQALKNTITTDGTTPAKTFKLGETYLIPIVSQSNPFRFECISVDDIEAQFKPLDIDEDMVVYTRFNYELTHEEENKVRNLISNGHQAKDVPLLHKAVGNGFAKLNIAPGNVGFILA